VYDDVGSRACEAQRQRSTDAMRAAGDQGDLADEFHVYECRWRSVPLQTNLRPAGGKGNAWSHRLTGWI
jgi:hypothetical protein